VKKVLLLPSLFIATLLFAQPDPENITIVRDKWGVPHIYAPKDEGAAYGLAWASAEDNFHLIQENLLPVKGRLAEAKGKDGAIKDVFAHLINVHDLVDANYETDISEKFKRVLEGYAAGINSYAKHYPDEVMLKGVFPIGPKDILKAYMLSMTFMTHVHFDVGRILKGYITRDEINLGSGSNGIALSNKKTSDGKTYLAINSHQPVEGPFGWYEAHLNSEEGLNILGANFPGGVSMLIGVNENLGWGHTLNYPDFDDVYKLTMHDKDKNKYWFDGKWEELEERKFKFKVKILGFLKIPVKQVYYWSKYGPTIRTKDGVYSIRFPANMDIRSAEQWYRMNKAKNFQEFKAALEMQSFSGINIVYADREHNIYYLCNGLFPYRNPSYDWKKVLPGDTSATLWEEKFHPLNELPQVLNPECGYVFNTNNTPFNATCQEENLNPDDYNPTMGFQTGDNNRSLRFQYLMNQYGRMGYDDFLDVKYDNGIMNPAYNSFIQNIEKLFSLDPTKYPDIADAIKLLAEWDRMTNIESVPASIAVYCIKYVVDDLFNKGILPGSSTVEPDLFAESIREAKKHMIKHFGKLEVPLGEIQRHIRGGKSYPMAGGPDVLAAMHTDYYKNGILKTRHGESYIELVKFSENGVEIETVNTFGASSKKDSPHYTDQMELFVAQKTKKMTLDKETIFREAKKIYHPK
jgi:acyl-homoserine-lactone acylase